MKNCLDISNTNIIKNMMIILLFTDKPKNIDILFTNINRKY